MKKIIGISFILAAAFSACENLDVVASDSSRAFGDLLDVVAPSTGSEVYDIKAPDESAHLFWASNYSSNSEYDIFMEFDAAPFIAAGLNIEAANNFLRGEKIIVGSKLGIEKTEAATLLDSYKELVKLRRNIIGYHAALDHYGITLGDGNLFEWAKNMSSNDKDMVFVLNPEPFIDAGVDVNNIEGWVFGKVTIDDENGKPIQVDKLLKPFNLKVQ